MLERHSPGRNIVYCAIDCRGAILTLLVTPRVVYRVVSSRTSYQLKPPDYFLRVFPLNPEQAGRRTGSRHLDPELR